jgi:YD repeat-containing protein
MVAIVTGAGLGLERSSGLVLGSKGTLGEAAVGRLGSNVTVNAATGNLVVQNQDEILIGQGPDSVLSRTYNSLGLLNDDNGDNWRESGQRSVVLASGTVNAAGSTVKRIDWDGSDVTFTWDASRSAYVSKEGAGAYDTITFASNVFTWTDGTSQIIDRYDYLNSGRIVSTADTDGNQLSYSYTGTNLTRVTTANGDYTDLSWSGNNLASVTTYYVRPGAEASAASQVYRMYDAAFDRSPDALGYDCWVNAMLGGVTIDQFADAIYNSGEYQGRGVSSMTNDIYVEFLYTTVLRRASDPVGKATHVANLNAGMSRATVLKNFSESAEHTAIAGSIPGRTPPALSAMTRTAYTYDASNRLSTVTTDLTPIGNTLRDGQTTVTTYTYDGTSKRVASISESGSGNFVTFNYVQVGSDYRVASLTEAAFSDDLRATSFSYDTANRRTTVTDALGKSTVLAYDTSGNLTSVSYPPSEAGAAAQVVQYAYNANGDVTSATDAMGKVTAYSYDSNGNLTESADAAGNRTHYDYDGANQVIKTTVIPNTARSRQLPGLGVDTSYYLAAYSDIAGAGDYVDPAVHYSTYGWHEGRNPNWLFNTNYYLAQNPDVAAIGMNPLQHYLEYGWREGRTPAAGVTTAEYIARYVHQATRYAYDSESHLRFVITPEGKVTEYRYNSAGQKISTVTYTNNVYNVGAIASTDMLNEATMTTWVAGLGNSSAVERTDTTYDFRGNIASTTDYSDLNVNRVRFSQFEQGTAGWWSWQSQPNMIQNTTTGTDAGTSKKYIQMTFRGASSSDWVAFHASDDSRMRVTPGERLAVRVGAGASAGVANLILRVQFLDANGGWLGESPDVASKTGAQAFNTLMSGFVDVPANAVQARIILYANAGTLNSNLTFSLTEPMVSQATADQTVVPAFSTGISAFDTTAPAVASAGYSRTLYTYDQFGLLLSSQTIGKGYTEVYTYDGLGRTLTATDSTGALTTTAYNDGGRTSTVTLANGMIKTSVFTAQGELWSYAESGSGVATETETYRYDKLGRLRLTSDAVGYRDFTFYDDAGRKTGEMDRRGMLTEYRYDAANRLIATIHYANQMSAAAINALYDANGNPTTTTTTIAGARPATTNSDRWEWNVYDNADRVVQKITTIKGASEGQSGAVTTYTYDGAGRLVQTTESANILAPNVVAGLMANPPGGLNRVYNGQFDTTAGWGTWGSTASLINAGSPVAGAANGKGFIKASFTATAASQVASFYGEDASRFRVTPGERLSVQAGVEALGAVGSLNLLVQYFDFYGNYLTNASAGVLYGTQSYNTKISSFVTVPAGAYSARLDLYMGSSAAGSGSLTLIEPMVSSATATQTTFPAFDATPVANTADRVTCNFYSNAGLLIGTVDGDGALKQFSYDKAGRLIKTTGYINPVPQNVRATGNFETLLGSINTTASDRVEYLVYNGQGQIRYRLDGNLRPTEYVYNRGGQVIRTIEYGVSIGASSVYSPSYVQGQIASLNLISNAETRISRNIYGDAGRLAFQIDAQGYVTRNFYNALSQVYRGNQLATRYTANDDPSITTMVNWEAANPNVADRTTRYIYDSFARLVYEVDPAGYITEHQYDLDDRVIKDIRYSAQYTVTDSATASSLAAQIGGLPADAVVKTYAYDASGNVIDKYDGLGNRTHYDFDAFNTAWQVTEAYGTADASVTSFIRDTSGRIVNKFTAVGTAEQTNTGYGYDGVGNLTSIYDPRGNTTTFTYDAVGNRLTQSVPLDGSTNAVTTYQYDAFGNVVKIIDPRSNASYNYYDKLDRLVLSVDAEGFVTQTSYTIGNDIASVKRYYLRASNIGSVATQPTLNGHALDAMTIYSYDKLGRLFQVTDAEGYYEQYGLNAFGDRMTVRNKLGGVTSNVFDALGRLVQETLPVGSTRADDTVQATSILNKFDYDARGNRTKMIEAYGLAEQCTTIYGYDKNDRLISKAGDAVQVTAVNYIGQTMVVPVESYAYDARGNRIQTTDAAGALTLAYYDHNDRKIAEVSPVGTLSSWSYDANGNVLTATVYGDAIALPASPGGAVPGAANAGNYRRTSFSYDLNGRLTATSVVNAGYFDGTTWQTQPAAITTQNVYDANGNIVRQLDGRSNSIFTWFDKLGRKIAQADRENYLTFWTLDGDGNAVKEERFATRLPSTPALSSDPAALRAGVAGNAGDRTTNFSYDHNGHRLTEQRTGLAYSSIAANGAKSDISGGSATVTYSYNGLGEVTRKTEATGDYVSYGYDVLGRQTNLTSSGYVDYSGTAVQPVIETRYDGLNNVTRTLVNNDRLTRYYYGAGGRLITSYTPDGANHSNYYDIVGHVIREDVGRGKSDGTAELDAALRTFDAAGRMTSEARAFWNGSAWVKGDTSASTTTAYGDVSTKGVNGLSQETFSYDAMGRIWRSTAGDGTVKLFAYDAAGNQTLTIASNGAALPSGYSWSSLTVAQAVGLLTSSGTATIGTVAVAGIAITINDYDKRGQLTQTREPLRETTAVGSALATITHGKSYNAFGEVASETDARSNVTSYTYNAIGRLTSKVMPQVSVTAENGAISTVSPAEYYDYDVSGRLVATRDANGNLITRSLLGGSGYGGADALVVKEFHADGGVRANGYDSFGDLRTITDELGRTESRSYDAMGRLTQLNRQQRSDGTQLIDYYSYDTLGQRLRHWNSQLGSGVVEKTDYDVQGRVVSQVDFAGRATTYGYSWNGALGTTGLGTFGAWVKTTVNTAGKTATEYTDYFGRTVGHTDFGGVNYGYFFDLAGHLSGRNNSVGESITYSYYNTGQLSGSTSTVTVADVQGNGSTVNYSRSTTGSYRYDADGNRIYEQTDVTISDPDLLGDHGLSSTATMRDQNSSTSYDALNRMTSYSDSGENGGNPVTIAYEYDAAGNVRHMGASYRDVAFGGTQTQDYWYKYDSMNRFVTTKGTFTGTRGSGTISRGAAGTDIVYDAAGERMSATKTVQRYLDLGIYGGSLPYDADQREDYSYTADGYLASVRIATGSYDTPSAPATGTLRATYTRDALGRLIDYAEYQADGSTLNYSRHALYDANSLVTDDVVQQRQSNGSVLTSNTHYDYTLDTGGTLMTGGTRRAFGTGGAYQGGVVTHTRTTRSDGTVGEIEIFYNWRDGALKSHAGNFTAATGNSSGHDDLEYDSAANLIGVEFVTGSTTGRTDYVNTIDGKVLGSWHSITGNSSIVYGFHYYANAVHLGAVGNDGTTDNDYATALDERTLVPGNLFRYGTARSFADFDQSYAAINPTSEGSTNSIYTVQSGDTLQSIALATWGDASLWYLIADANGLSGGETLLSGRTLTIPARVTNAHNSASTFKVYDPNQAFGNTDPIQPNPTAAASGKGKKCGAFGAILLVVIAVAVTVVTAGAAVAALVPAAAGATATTAATIAGGISALAAGTTGLGIGALAIGAAAGALGSIVSQGIGVATGLQDKFSWKGVALSAIAGGVSAGLGGSIGSGWAAAAARGAVGSVVSQGIGVATGLQSKFDWAGVAAAGVGAGVGNWVGHGPIISGMAGGISASAAESLVTGRDFGDTLMANLPGIIGNTIGNLAASKIASIGNGPSGQTGAGDGKAAEPQAGEDHVLTQGARDKLRADVFLTAAGGDAEAARGLLLRSYGPTYDEAVSNAASSGQVIEGVSFSGGDHDGTVGSATMGGSDHWSRDFSSFGHDQFTDSSLANSVWVENSDVMQRVNADLATFDRQALQGSTLGFRFAAEAVTGDALLGGAIRLASWGRTAFAAQRATGAFNPGVQLEGGLGIFAERQLTVTSKGLDLVRGHLAKFGDVPANTAMLERLETAMAAGQRVSGADAIFYTHEAAEATKMARGLSYDVAHAASLEKYGVSPYSVYHPDVIRAMPEHFNSNWYKFWGIK